MQKIKKARLDKVIKKFVISFVVGLLAGSILFSIIKGYSPVVIDEATSFTASTVGFFLGLLGMAVKCQAEFVSLNGYGFKVIDQCLGAYEVFIFSAGVIAYPTDSRKKLWGIALGIPFLYFINIVRLMVLGVVGTVSPGISSFMHLYLWQIIIFLTVLLACLLWIKLIVQPGRGSY